MAGAEATGAGGAGAAATGTGAADGAAGASRCCHHHHPPAPSATASTTATPPHAMSLFLMSAPHRKFLRAIPVAARRVPLLAWLQSRAVPARGWQKCWSPSSGLLFFTPPTASQPRRYAADPSRHKWRLPAEHEL